MLETVSGNRVETVLAPSDFESILLQIPICLSAFTNILVETKKLTSCSQKFKIRYTNFIIIFPVIFLQTCAAGLCAGWNKFLLVLKLLLDYLISRQNKSNRKKI